MTTWEFYKYLLIKVLINSLENCQALQWTMNKMKRIIPTLEFLYFLKHILKFHINYIFRKKVILTKITLVLKILQNKNIRCEQFKYSVIWSLFLNVISPDRIF